MVYQKWPFWISCNDQRKLTNAISLAFKYHEGQIRKYSGEPYIVHPMRVAMAVSSHPKIKLFEVQAAILHDVKEDTKISDEEISCATSNEVLVIVNELTNQTKDLKGIPRRDRKKLDWERLSKVSNSAKVIKMFDRIDNLRDMVNAPPQFKQMYTDETLELLKVIGDADKDIARQLKEACKDIFGWREFLVDELLRKMDGVEIEHNTNGIGVVRTIDSKKTIVFNSGKKIIIDESLNKDWNFMRETGKCLV